MEILLNIDVYKDNELIIKRQLSKTFDYKEPIKVIDKRKNLLGIGFLNIEQFNINPKLVLNAK